MERSPDPGITSVWSVWTRETGRRRDMKKPCLEDHPLRPGVKTMGSGVSTTGVRDLPSVTNP